jgi:NAD(P)-dependent dehydrogenase (short-subunit alcohol dehydrogenase family)
MNDHVKRTGPAVEAHYQFLLWPVPTKNLDRRWRELDATFVTADLVDPFAARELFDAAEEALGSVSILVHSASPKRRENETALAVTIPKVVALTTLDLLKS